MTKIPEKEKRVLGTIKADGAGRLTIYLVNGRMICDGEDISQTYKTYTLDWAVRDMYAMFGGRWQLKSRYNYPR